MNIVYNRKINKIYWTCLPHLILNAEWYKEDSMALHKDVIQIHKVLHNSGRNISLVRREDRISVLMEVAKEYDQNELYEKMKKFT